MPPCLLYPQRLRSADTNSALAARCCTIRQHWGGCPLHDARKRTLDVCVHMRAESDKLVRGGPATASQVAVGASDSKIQLVYKLDKLTRQLIDALAEKAHSDEKVEARVRCEFEGQSDYSGVKRLLLKGRLKEEQVLLQL